MILMLHQYPPTGQNSKHWLSSFREDVECFNFPNHRRMSVPGHRDLHSTSSSHMYWLGPGISRGQMPVRVHKPINSMSAPYLEVNQRKSFLKDKKICFNCLRSGHIVSSYSSWGLCRRCNAKEYTLLHQGRTSSPSPGQPTSTQLSTPGAREDSHRTPSSIVAGPVHVLLGTARGHINDSINTRWVPLFTYDIQLCEAIGLPGGLLLDAPLMAGGVPLPHLNGKLKC